VDLSTYISDMPRRRQLADRLDTDPRYLYQIASGRRRSSPAFAREIEIATGDLGPEAVPKESIRPDVWGPVDAKRAPKRARSASSRVGRHRAHA
jgi:DNA-binding transcriptional regulator YdaS (Cro superfamily)